MIDFLLLGISLIIFGLVFVIMLFYAKYKIEKAKNIECSNYLTKNLKGSKDNQMILKSVLVIALEYLDIDR